MKKKFIIALSFFTFILGFAFMGNQVFAEEVQDEQPQTTEQVEEEEITISVKLNEFMNKWLIPSTSGALGLLGSFLMYVLTKKRYAILMNKLTSGVKVTEEARKKANEDYIKAKEELERQKEDYKDILEEMKADLKELKEANANLSTFKELIALLVTSTPELARSGIGAKMLMLLDEKNAIENVGDDNGTSNN